MAQGALSGTRVLDLSRVLAGPFCTQLLGDYGAEIIKVEEPGSGDGTRSWGPPWVGDQSAYFLCANRNKRSITVNLKAAQGRLIIQRLAAVSDVLIENFKPGALERMGLDYAALVAINPRLVYCSLTGYGQTGPYRDRPGYDFIIQAQGGVMSITGPEDGEPFKVGVAIADITTGLYAATAILAALHERTVSGLGQQLDVALLDAQIAWLANVAQNYLVSHQTPARYGNAHASIVPYQTFQTSTGYVAVGIGSDEQYRKFCAAIGRLDLSQDERFSTNQGRVVNRDTLVPLLREIFCTRSTDEWIELVTAAGAPAGPINDVRQALDDPQVRAREMVQTVQHATQGPIELLGPVAKFSRTPAAIHLPPPTLGQHTDELLCELLGYTAQECAQLRADGVV